jgi:predicted DNA-binding transcriptional regulator AlpA
MESQSATVYPFPRRGWEPWLTKKQLAAHFGYSTRWVELRVREGMPSKLIGGRRRFRLSEVEAWIEERANDR